MLSDKVLYIAALEDTFTAKIVHIGAVLYPYQYNLWLDEEKSELIGCVCLDLLQQDEGPWEEKFACGEEEDLHKHYNTCRKNPGHRDFFPVDKFNMDNLPLFYLKNKIMVMIKCMLDRTVRVSVKYVSEERPETVPGTDIPYPWHSNRGSNQLRVGSGWVTEVKYSNNNACECEECQSCDTPKIGFAHVYVKTAAHLVYDELEGKHTSCHLFYDSGETPNACEGVVTLRNICDMNTIEDTCMLKYVTHDLDFARKLKGSKTNNFDIFLEWLKYKSWQNSSNNRTCCCSCNPTLDIVVSHPHGRAKQICIGYYGNHDNTDNHSRYNSIICPGSSGAPVITLGSNCFYPFIE